MRSHRNPHLMKVEGARPVRFGVHSLVFVITVQTTRGVWSCRPFLENWCIPACSADEEFIVMW